MAPYLAGLVVVVSSAIAAGQVTPPTPVVTSTVPVVSSWGPGKCVSTWKGANGTCIMKTSCAGQETSNYIFSLICLEDSGKVARHVFGKNSFDPVETFDTLIQCKECRADPSAQTANQAAVDPGSALNSMAADVAEMKNDMTTIVASVQKLNVQVFGTIAPITGVQSKSILTAVTPDQSILTAVVAQHVGQPQVQRTKMNDKMPQQASRSIQKPAVSPSGMPSPRTFLGSSIVEPPPPMPQQRPKRAYDAPEAFLPPPDAVETQDDNDSDDADEVEVARTAASDDDASVEDTSADGDDSNPGADDDADDDTEER